MQPQNFQPKQSQASFFFDFFGERGSDVFLTDLFCILTDITFSFFTSLAAVRIVRLETGGHPP